MTRVRLYWETLRHLKPVQLYGRLRLRFPSPAVDMRPAPPLAPVLAAAWIAPAPHAQSHFGDDHFRFLNRTLALDEHGWDDPRLDKLWRYNLHYFDDLNATGHEHVSRQEALLARWVRENPPAGGSGWEPYPTSLRIVNWIKWHLAGHALPTECVESLAVQARWLSRRLEVHLLGNHLLANAKALIFAGLAFAGPEADRWQDLGLTILGRELPEQILPDGGHVERSPMYHALVLEDLLDLWNAASIAGDRLPARWQSALADWRPRIQAMRAWLAAMSHPDGDIGFFNDAAQRIAVRPEELDRYAERLGLGPLPPVARPLTQLAASGYVRIDAGDAVALLDVAPLGPDYLLGHAHADTLSFELSLFGGRIFVNSGTSEYGTGLERLRQRGTAAHNTVVVDGQDSSEVWSGFRVARRARARLLSVREEAGEVRIRCAHDGYRRLPGHPEHIRELSLDPIRATLTVSDVVRGPCSTAEARFHLHPAVELDSAPSARRARLVLPGGRRADFVVTRGALDVEDSSWHPEFGVRLPTRCLRVVLDGGESHVQIRWEGVA